MNEKYNVYLNSDSTGETLDRIFLSLQSQFKNFKYDKKEFFFVRTQQQVDKIINDGIKGSNPINSLHNSRDKTCKIFIKEA